MSLRSLGTGARRRHFAGGRREVAVEIARRNPVARRERDDLILPARKQRIGIDDECTGLLPGNGRQGRIDLARSTGAQNDDPLPDDADAPGPKRLELLRELVPQAATIAFLVSPINPLTETDTRDMQAAARSVPTARVPSQGGWNRLSRYPLS